MKLTTLGTGGPRPDAKRGASAHAVEIDEGWLLVDCGRGAVRAVAAAGLDVRQLAAILITHHHFDHIGELADMLISSWMIGRRAPLPLYGPPGTARLYRDLMQGVYRNDLRFRVEGERLVESFAHPVVHEVRGGDGFDVLGAQVRCEEMVHGHGLEGFTPEFRDEWVCLGYRVEQHGAALSLSGDGVMSDGLIRLARGATLHLQCCYLAAADLSTPFLKGVAAHTLACSDTAGVIARQAGVERMVLTHFRNDMDARLPAIEADVRTDFAGAVMLAHDLDVFTL
jgi:ribonuclease Z